VGKPVLTGPSLVDKTNIAQILPYTKNNRASRIPGSRRGPAVLARAPAAPFPLSHWSRT
jgi:hypothetical protein